MASKNGQGGISTTVVVVMLIALAALGAWWYFAGRPREATPPPAVSADAKAYTKNLRLGGVEMKATESYTGSALVEITGKITNAGDRSLNRIELNCLFLDPAGQVVLRERLPIVKTHLKPGETRNFRLPFEGIPTGWNQALPQMVIAHIEFI